MLANIIHANTAEMTHDDTHAAPAWSLLSMNVRLLTLAYFLHTLHRCRNGVLLDPLIISKCISKKYDYLFLFSIPPTAEVARTEDTLYQPSLITGHVSRYRGADSCV